MNSAGCGVVRQGGFTALSVAVQQNHHQVAAVLLEAEAGSRFQLPALHVAAKKDDVKSLSLLLKSKHDPNSVTKVKIRPRVSNIADLQYVIKVVVVTSYNPYKSTSILPPFDCSFTALRPFDDLRHERAAALQSK